MSKNMNSGGEFQGWFEFFKFIAVGQNYKVFYSSVNFLYFKRFGSSESLTLILYFLLCESKRQY